MATKRDYYDVLGVSKAASDQEIKAAFRRLAKECHPDRCNGDRGSEKRFKEANEAYEALKDPQKRAAYDRFGHAAFEGGMGAHTHGFGADFSASMSAMFDDLFGEFMGQRRPRQRSARQRGAAGTFATIGRSRWPRLMKASRRRSACRHPSPASPALGQGRRQAPRLRPAAPAEASARCARRRASSPSSGPVRPARGAAR